MRLFARPAVAAGALAAAGVLVHPALHAMQWPPYGPLLVVVACLMALVVLFVPLADAVRERQTGPVLLGAGAVLVVGALAFDGVRGHEGSIELVPGQTLGSFEERRPDGRSLGLRPLPFAVGLVDAGPGARASVVFSGSEAPAVVTPARAVGHGGFRFASPRLEATGEPGGAVTLDVHHEPAGPVALAGLVLALCGVVVRR